KKDSESWVYKMESNLKELTKAIMDLMEQNKALNIWCYKYNQEGHIAKNCPNRTLQPQQNNQDNAKRNNQTVNLEIRGLNIRLFEIKESISNKSKQYLMIKFEGNNL
ncbi:30669_t:CDS:2, partial [Gigaspora margarita]